MGRKLALIVDELDGRERDTPWLLYSDNEAAIAQIKLGVHAAWRSRHISIRGAALAEAHLSKEIEVLYKHTKVMSADGLTKALGPHELQTMRNLWGMVQVV